jgi:hypothetical protein
MGHHLAGGIAAALGIVGVVAAGAAGLASLDLPEPHAVTTTGGGGAQATELAPRSGIPQCDVYRGVPEAYGFCLYKFSGGFPNPEDVARICPLAGEWADDCRHSWVAGRMSPDSGYEIEQLLEICGSNADCTFELLDFRPAAEIDLQLERCRLYAMQHAPNCTGHAMQRWWLEEKPDAEEIARVASLPSAYPRKVGFWIAASVECYDVGTCEGSPAVQAACEGQATSFARKPENCPSKEKARLNTGGVGPDGGQLQPGEPMPPGTPPAAGRPPGRPVNSPGGAPAPGGGGAAAGQNGNGAATGQNGDGAGGANGGNGGGAGNGAQDGAAPGTPPKRPKIRHQPGTIPSGVR